jgi:predicted MFS family arabinose efflux permease
VFSIKKSHFLFASTFFYSLAGNVLNFSLVYRLADRFDFNPGQVGVFLALGQLFYFGGCNLYHRFGSAFNPAKVVPVAAGMALLVSFPLGYARVQGVVYASYWLFQLGTSFFWPPLMAWLTGGLGDKDLNREISVYNRSWMAALMVGPLIAGTLYRWNSNANFILINVSFFAVNFLLYLMRRFLRRNEPENETFDSLLEASFGIDDEAGRISALLSRANDKSLDIYRYRSWVCIFCSNLTLGILVNIIPLHIRDGLGFTEQSAGMMLFFRCAAGFVCFAILGKFSAWHFKRWWFVCLTGGLALCATMFFLAGNSLVFFFVIAGLFGLFNSGCNTTSTFYAGATGKNPKKNLALHEIFLSLGTAIGSAGGGFLYQHFRFTGMNLALTLLLVICLGLLILPAKKKRSAGPAERI